MQKIAIAVVAIIICGMVLTFLLKIALEMLKVTGGVLFSLTTGAKELILNIGGSIIGLFQSSVKLNIPQELETHDAASRLQYKTHTDYELIDLEKYSIQVQDFKEITIPKLVITSPELRKKNAPLSLDANIESLSDIKKISNQIPYHFLSEKLLHLRSVVINKYYPYVCNIIKPPIKCKPLQVQIPEPEFELPLRRGVFSFLNIFIEKYYEQELLNFKLAKTRRNEVVVSYAKRNSYADKLYNEKLLNYLSIIESAEIRCSTVNELNRSKISSFNKEVNDQINVIENLISPNRNSGETGLISRLELMMQTIELPEWTSSDFEAKFDSNSGILISEHRFPDLEAINWYKKVSLKKGETIKPLNQKERREASASVYPSLSLRLCQEILRLDTENIIKSVAINGWAEFIGKSTGKKTRAYCSSLFATRELLEGIDCANVDPIAAFSRLRGIRSPSLEVTPIAPTIRLNKEDQRFIANKEVLSNLSTGENLAAMDWEAFEHLCRELFERLFSQNGAEVKITRASRDQGVDAIIFDPDPLRGGKIVVQAKRYTNLVDVSSVRDLYGTVMNEGAIKGILVTTSHYGSDSYEFAKDKPITLINGAELLGLLDKNGYKFRIDISEAKKLAASSLLD